MDNSLHSAEVAQLVEQRTENAWVASSSLALGTQKPFQHGAVFCLY